MTERADWLGLQFPTWYILPVDYVYQWVYRDTKGKAIKCQMCGVQRSQSSYNAGVWENYKIEIPENQRKAILPMNEISATIFYNQRFIISAPIKEPLAWRLTKSEDISPKGVRRLTFAQDLFDQHKDYIERDEFGNIVGMYADWFQSEVEPVSVLPTDTPTPSPATTATITCSGKQQIRIGGSAKTFTVVFVDEDGTSIDTLPGTWEFSIDGNSVPQELLMLSATDNHVKVKFLGDDSYIGKILTVTYKVDGEDISASLPIEIIAL